MRYQIFIWFLGLPPKQTLLSKLLSHYMMHAPNDRDLDQMACTSLYIQVYKIASRFLRQNSSDYSLTFSFETLRSSVSGTTIHILAPWTFAVGCAAVVATTVCLDPEATAVQKYLPESLLSLYCMLPESHCFVISYGDDAF